MYVARTRNGFVPASPRQVFSRLKHLVTPKCPFVNLPETRKSRFGEELNVEKMKKAVAEDKNPRDVVKEQLAAEE